jgi:hypothetical protein
MMLMMQNYCCLSSAGQERLVATPRTGVLLVLFDERHESE